VGITEETDAVAVVVSEETRKSKVAQAALAAGADIINDISGLTYDPAMAGLAAESGAGLILMHMRGTPQTMQDQLQYDDLLPEINDFLAQAMAKAEQAGVAKDCIVLDPGIGFAKDVNQNLMIMKEIAGFRNLGRPLLVGPSRKSFIGQILNGIPPEARQWGTAGAVAWLLMQRVEFIRVHDIKAMNEVKAVVERINPADGD